MCGISGIIDFNNNLQNGLLKNYLNDFLKILNHRGPDSNGLDIFDNVGFAHNRLSIIDLSQNAHQPMSSNNKDFVISFNGEIYNFQHLKKSLPNFSFKSTSDTEVLLEYISKFGIEKTLEDINGMYAFSLLDKKNKRLFLCRDKYGKKPIYYYHDNEYFIFGSELNIFFKSPIKNRLEPCEVAIKNYFDVGYIPSQLSIFKNIYKVLPGEIITIDLLSNKILKKQTKVIEQSNNFTLVNNLKDLENILIDSVNLRTIADVPYGVFLSSGVDSSLVAALCQSQKNYKIDTFSIGVRNSEMDESEQSRKIAKQLNTNHHEFIVDENELINCFEIMPKIYSEPFSDSSQFPTYILSKFTREKVKVALSGDGGDEIFCGYNRYLYPKKYYYLLKILFQLNSNGLLNKKIFNFILKIKNFFPLPQSIIDKMENTIKIKNISDLYKELVKNKYDDNLNILKNLNTKDTFYNKNIYNDKFDYITFLQALDVQNYLPDDILTKVDRASMYNSLEVRCPLLDTRLSNAVYLDENKKINKNNTKFMLRKILSKYININYISKEKKGFSIPVKDWVNGGLKNLILDLVNSKECEYDNYLNQKNILQLLKVNETANGKYASFIWSLAIYLQWKIYFKKQIR